MNECNSVVLQKVKTGFGHSCQFGMVKLRVLLCLSKKQKWYYCWEMTSRNSRHSDIYLRIAELRGEEEQHFYPSWLRTSLLVKLREKGWMGALRCEPGPPVPWCQGSVTTPVLPPPYASAVLACIQHSHLCLAQHCQPAPLPPESSHYMMTVLHANVLSNQWGKVCDTGGQLEDSQPRFHVSQSKQRDNKLLFPL